MKKKIRKIYNRHKAATVNDIAKIIGVSGKEISKSYAQKNVWFGLAHNEYKYGEVKTITHFFSTIFNGNMPKFNNKKSKRLDIYQRQLELITFNDEFRKEAYAFRIKFAIPSINGFKNPKNNIFSNEFNIWKNKLHEEDYHTQLRKILKKFNISSRWLNAIEYYLLFNKTNNYNVLPKSVEIKIMRDSSFYGEEGLAIQINPDTTWDDIKAVWDDIKIFRGSYLAEINEYKNPPFLNRNLYKDAFRNNQDFILTSFIEYSKNQKNRAISEKVFQKYKMAYQLVKLQGYSNKVAAKKMVDKKIVQKCTARNVEHYVEEFKKILIHNKLI